MLFILSLPYAAIMLGHNGFLALLPFVKEEFDLTRTQIGIYSSFFFFSAAILAVFTGKFVDLIGPKKGVLIGVTCLGCMLIFFGLSPTYKIILFLAIIAGFGFSIITPSVNKAVMTNMPPNKMAISMGIMQSGSGVGGLAGASLLPLIGIYFGWRVTIQLAGILCIGIGLLVYKYYKDKNKVKVQEDMNQQINKENKHNSFFCDLIGLLKNKQFVSISLLGLILAGASLGASVSHFTVFCTGDLQMSQTSAGLGLGIFQIGGTLSRPIWGWLSDRLMYGDRRKAIFIICQLAGFMFILIGMLSENINISPLVLFIFSFTAGFFVFGWSGILFVSIAEIAGVSNTGAATGLTLLFIRFGVLVGSPIFGLIADIGASYYYSWLVFGVVLIIASLLYYFSNKV